MKVDYRKSDPYLHSKIVYYKQNDDDYDDHLGQMLYEIFVLLLLSELFSQVYHSH